MPYVLVHILEYMQLVRYKEDNYSFSSELLQTKPYNYPEIEKEVLIPKL
jgi:hypothetical protein